LVHTADLPHKREEESGAKRTSPSPSIDCVSKRGKKKGRRRSTHDPDSLNRHTFIGKREEEKGGEVEKQHHCSGNSKPDRGERGGGETERCTIKTLCLRILEGGEEDSRQSVLDCTVKVLDGGGEKKGEKEGGGKIGFPFYSTGKKGKECVKTRVCIALTEKEGRRKGRVKTVKNCPKEEN